MRRNSWIKEDSCREYGILERVSPYCPQFASPTTSIEGKNKNAKEIKPNTDAEKTLSMNISSIQQIGCCSFFSPQQKTANKKHCLVAWKEETNGNKHKKGYRPLAGTRNEGKSAGKCVKSMEGKIKKEPPRESCVRQNRQINKFGAEILTSFMSPSRSILLRHKNNSADR